MALTQQDKEELYQYIVSRGQSIAGLPEGEATLTNKYLGPVIEYGGGDASGRLVRLAVSLLQGKPAMLRNEGGLIQWAVQGTNAWETLVNVSQLKGENGKNPVFRKNGPNLEYKIDGTPDTAYQTLVALSEITGPEGDHIVLDVRDGAVMYKQSKAPDSDFQPVFFLADVKGEKGDTGPAPILVFGTVTTVEPSEPAAAEWVENGIDASGAKIYQLNLSIPKGRAGADGSGSGNVLVDPTGLLAAKQYAFRPGQDGSANGSFVEVEIPEAGACFLPEEVAGIPYVTTSDEIFACWGGKAAMLDFVKNFDSKQVHIIQVPGVTSVPVSVEIDYTDDNNYTIGLIIPLMQTLEIRSLVQSGVASARTYTDRAIQNTSPDGADEIYLSYGGNDGKDRYDIIWNNNPRFDDVTGVGRRHLAFSTGPGKSILLENTGDGTKYLNNQGQYAIIPVASATANGLLSKEDKAKLDGLAEGGSGSGADLLIPADLMDLTQASTSAEIQAVLESAGGFDALVASVKSAKSITIHATRTASPMTYTEHYPVTAAIAEVAGADTVLLFAFVGTGSLSTIQITKNAEGNLSITT